MKKILWLAVLLLPLVILAQEGKVIANKATHFSLDDIDFILVDTVLTKKKPVILFCQGSQPVPLFMNFEKTGLYFGGGGVTNFDLIEIRKRFHLIVIAMPATPLIADEKDLNSSYAYYEDKANPNIPTDAFSQADYLQNYVDRAEKVVAFLQKQPWVSNEKLVVCGHSQGSKIASKIALRNEKVSHLGLFGANPFGRIDQEVRQARLDAHDGKISWEEANQQIEDSYSFFKMVNKEGATEANPELKSWKTFSEPAIYDWLKINQPIYLAYGTEDRATDLCDIVPLFFIQNQKDNLTLKRYIGLEHNFYELSGNGRLDAQKPHWKVAMNEFLKWTELN